MTSPRKQSILIMGASYEIPKHETRKVEDSFAASGYNSGNLLIGNGLFSQLDCEHVASYTYSMSPEYIEENFDMVAIAAANFLHPKFDFTPLSSVLDKIKLPVCMVGLGAQLPTTSSKLENIPEGTWRLVHIAAERSKTIGVRGYFTAETLKAHGIKNIRVTGCPSLYTNLNHSTRIRRPNAITADKVVVNGSRNVYEHASDKDAAIRTEKALFKYAFDNKNYFVLQNEEPEIQISKGLDLDEKQALALGHLEKFFGISKDQFAQYYKERGKIFFSVKEWFEWIKQFDFSIGTRFHGNLAALLNGVPAVIIVHDSRTQEMCEFAAIPHISIKDINEINPQAIYEKANFDLFEERYNALHRKYVEFLNENGISHKLNWIPDLSIRGRIRF